MALSVNSSSQNPTTLLNTNANGTGYALLTQQLTGTTSVVQVGPIGAPTSVPATSSMAVALTTPGGTTLNQTEVVTQPSQPGTTPDITGTADPSGAANLEFDNDAYRSGNGPDSSPETGDNLVNPRTISGEDDGEGIAAISLTTQLSSVNSGNGAGFNATNANTNSIPDGTVVNAYSRFFLQSVKEAQIEKFQIVETFTAFYTFFYGKRPPIYTFTGTLMNDQNHKWTNDLMYFYENFFRGTQSVKLGAQAVVSYDGRYVTGFLLGLNMQTVADVDKGAMFSFDVLVLKHVPLYFSADIQSLITQASGVLQSQQSAIQAQAAQLAPSLSTSQVMNGVQKPTVPSIPNQVTSVTPVSYAAPAGGLF